MAERSATPAARFGRNILVLAGLIIALSLAGLGGVASVAGPPILLMLLLGLLIPWSRPGRWAPTRRGRSAHRINYLGHYGNAGSIDAAGVAVIVALAIGNLAKVAGGEMTDLQYGIVFGFSFASQFFVPRPLREPAEELLAMAASLALAVTILRYPASEALVSQAVFLIAAAVAALILWGVSALPGMPVLLYARRGKIPGKAIAYFALLELAAKLAFPLENDRLGEPAVLDLWDEQTGAAGIYGLAIMVFAGLSVLTAYSPRFMAAMIGLSLAILHLYFEGWYRLLAPAT